MCPCKSLIKICITIRTILSQLLLHADFKLNENEKYCLQLVLKINRMILSFTLYFCYKFLKT